MEPQGRSRTMHAMTSGPGKPPSGGVSEFGSLLVRVPFGTPKTVTRNLIVNETLLWKTACRLHERQLARFPLGFRHY